MGHLVIAAYRPHPGKDADLQEQVRGHIPTLLAEGLITERMPITMRAADGTIVEVFEWLSEEAVKSAHANPQVLAMWERFAACCDYVSLASLPESASPFPHFTPIDL